MPPRFVHLHLHTEFSVVDGIVRIKALLQRCVSMGMNAVAITDVNNFFAAVKFFKAAKGLKIKPIIGVEVLVKDPRGGKHTPNNLILLCQNQQGYKNAMELISASYTNEADSKSVVPLTTCEELQEKSEGLLAISCAHGGDINKAIASGDTKKAEELIKFWQGVYPERFYVEVCRTDREGEEAFISNLLPLVSELEIPIVATNDVRFLDEDDFIAHEARVCIHDSYVLDDPKRPKIYSSKQYLRSPEEMVQVFHDLPEAVLNGIEIVKRCNFKISLGKTFLPIFPIETLTDKPLEEYFIEQSKLGLKHRLETVGSFAPLEEYEKRLEYELGIILQMGFPSYFLIVADFIKWSKENDIPVGPGRGSGAGSLVAYSLLITDLDPLQHELLFERFLNPERVSMPDFDIDFCMERRDEVIEYVVHRYGKEKVAQIITYGTMAARAVVRDVGRVLGYPYGFVDKIAKLIPFAVGMTLQEAMKQEEKLKELYDNDEEVKPLINLALKLEGITRNLGKHAGGVVISPSKLTDFSALYCEPGEAEHVVTQYDKDDLEKVGLVKFDFLGLRTLTIIHWALQTINARLKKQVKEPVDITKLPLDDPDTFKLLKNCATTAVFQLESRGMKELIKKLQPDCFDDITALVALYRPGPLQSGMVDDFIERKHGRADVAYPHPSLESALKPTYGVILYQEQVMEISRVLAGYSLGGADLLRRAMGKKKVEVMNEQRAIFEKGAVDKGIDKKIATSVFDLMAHFAGYGFNKSHSAAYALISYQTAWLKAHYPAEFMAAVLSSDMDNTDKVVNFLNECKMMKLEVVPPNINQSEYKFSVGENGEIIYGLGAIKGVGLAALEDIIQNRNEKGAFHDLFEFCKRVDRKRLNKKVVEALIYSGALDDLGPNRATIFAAQNQAFTMADQNARSKKSGQRSLFAGDDEEDSHTDNKLLYKDLPEWPLEELLTGEKATLGFYLSGHPFDTYALETREILNTSISDLTELCGQTVVVAGLIHNVRSILTKKGKKMAIVNLEDSCSSIDAVVFSDLLDEAGELLAADNVIFVEGDVDVDNFSGGLRMRAKRIFDLDQARNTYAKYLMLKLDKSKADQKLFTKLAEIIGPHKGGGCPIYISYLGDKANAKLQLGEEWKVRLSSGLLEGLREKIGVENVVVKY